MTSLALVSDLETRLRLEVGSLDGADLQAAEDALDDASVLVRDAGLASWTPANVPEPARLVVIRCALRQYRNPDGFSSEAMGAGAYTYRYADDETSAYLTEREVAIVEKAATATSTSTARSGARTVHTPAAYDEPSDAPPDPWWW